MTFLADVREVRAFMENPSGTGDGWDALTMAAEMLRDAEERHHPGCRGSLRLGDCPLVCRLDDAHDGPHTDGTTIWFGDKYPVWEG